MHARVPLRVGLVVLTCAVVAGITGSGRAAPSTDCSGAAADIVGTDGNDTLPGTPENDIISGLGGDDTIDGGDGRDLICAGGRQRRRHRWGW
jgi:Ca2+-binding RTX toxin-like protein